MVLCLQRGWMSLTIWTNHWLTTSSTLHTTRTSQVTYAYGNKDRKHIVGSFPWEVNSSFFPHPVSVFSGSADWSVFSGDVQAGAADRLPLCGAGLLEGPNPRWWALHHPRVHDDHWDLLQGGHLYTWPDLGVHSFPFDLFIDHSCTSAILSLPAGGDWSHSRECFQSVSVSCHPLLWKPRRFVICLFCYLNFGVSSIHHKGSVAGFYWNPPSSVLLGPGSRPKWLNTAGPSLETPCSSIHWISIR